MKKPILHLFTLFAFIIAMLHPAINLNAAELWNSNKSSNSYYNKGKSKNNGSSTLYNRQNSGYSRNNLRTGSVSRNVQTYKNIRIAREVKQSKLWSLMDKFAIQSRQADVNLSLQREYDTRIRIRSLLRQAAKQRRASYLAGRQRLKERKIALDAARNAKRNKEWLKKYRSLRPNASLDRDVRSRSGVKKRKKILKKPTKLYNSRY